MYLKDYSVSPPLAQLITDNGGHKVNCVNVIQCVPVFLYDIFSL